jgi:hypothetical protein
LGDTDFSFHFSEYERLRAKLQAEFDASQLPELPTAQAGLHDLLVRLRMR